MQRTQISLTEEDRRLLDAESARTGKSLSALIRNAVAEVYGDQRDVAADILAIRSAAGAWRDRDEDGAAYVERLRSGRRIADLSH